MTIYLIFRSFYAKLVILCFILTHNVWYQNENENDKVTLSTFEECFFFLANSNELSLGMHKYKMFLIRCLSIDARQQPQNDGQQQRQATNN